MANRIFYAVQSIDFGGVTTGFQSVSVNSSVDFEQVFELGRLDVYENLEGVPSVEITAERAFPTSTGSTIWTTAGGGNTQDAAIARVDINMSVADDSQSTFSAENFLQSTGTYISSWSCNFPVEGFATESCTVVGNHLSWSDGSGGVIHASATGNASGTGLVVRRQDVTNYAKLQSVSFNADIGREDLFELGEKSPYFRSATFPIETGSEWEYLAAGGLVGPQFGSALEFDPDDNSDQTSDVSVSFEGVSIGSAARLNATSYSGGDAGGGNATVTYSYIAYNYLTAP